MGESQILTAEMKEGFAQVNQRMTEMGEEIRQEFRQELRQEIQKSERKIRRYVRKTAEETRRHFDVAAERMQSTVELLVEREVVERVEAIEEREITPSNRLALLERKRR